MSKQVGEVGRGDAFGLRQPAATFVNEAAFGKAATGCRNPKSPLVRILVKTCRDLKFLPLLFLLGLASCTHHQVAMRQDDFGLNFVPVRVNGQQGTFLVDTGASHTVLDYRFAKRSLRDLSSSNLRLAWLGSRNAETHEGVVNEIIIGDYVQFGPYRVHVLNLDAINHAPARKRTMRMDGILGADFLITHGAVVDYRGNLLRFQPAPAAWAPAPQPMPLR